MKRRSLIVFLAAMTLLFVVAACNEQPVLPAAETAAEEEAQTAAQVGANGPAVSQTQASNAAGATSLSTMNHEGTVSGVLESDDGNLVVDHLEPTDAIDWESFLDENLAEAWNFTVLIDRTGNPDDIFGGGVKQDAECPTVREGSLGGGDNKFDLKRIYLATKSVEVEVDGELEEHIFLFLAWMRVDGSPPTASAHIGYEFNKGTLGACPNSDLLRRVEGDMLVVYNFEGGDSDSTVQLSRWLTAAGGWTAANCEVAKSLPCWGNTQELTSLGFADGQVNGPSIGSVYDPLYDEMLSVAKFGEAAIDLSAAGVFTEDECESFGFASGVSRSSGNSGQAQMKDKVGPEQFTIANCGSILVKKVDEGGNPLYGAEFTVTPGQTTDGTTALFSVLTEFEDGIHCIDDMLIGVEYTVSETEAPPNYEAGPDQTFTVTEVSTCAERISEEDDPDLTFYNAQLTGRIVVHKVDEDDNFLAGARFTITNGVNVEMEETSEGSGIFCTDGLVFGEYTVTETPPLGYTGGDPQQVTVNTAATCDDGDLSEAEDALVFENQALYRVVVFVCHEPSLTLAQSTVTQEVEVGEDVVRQSLGAAANELLDALCASDGEGALFIGFTGGEEVDLTVNVNE